MNHRGSQLFRAGFASAKLQCNSVRRPVVLHYSGVVDRNIRRTLIKIGDRIPENEMHTTAFWLTLEHELLAALPFTLSERQSGIFGLIYALSSMATLLLMCDRRDLGTAVGERPPSGNADIEWEEFAAASTEKEFFEPNLYLYDAYPGGIGFSEPLYRICQELLTRTRELITDCPCDNGCPSCVGPAGDNSERSKEVTLAILARLCA